VSFRLKGQAHTFRAEYDEWIDLTLLDLINRLIAETGIQLVSFFTGDQGAFLVALTDQEQKAIAEQRPWNFDFTPR
jgi:hypothetical protein